MRILHVLAGAETGGAETAYAELCIAQKQAGMDVHAACRPSHRNAAMVEADVPVSELPFGGMLDFKTKAGLRRLIRDIRPDVVVTWMNRAAKKLPKKVPGVAFTWVPRLGGYYNPKNYKGAEHFVVIAPDIGRWLTDHGIPAESIDLISNFASVDAQAEPVSRETLETPEDAFVFLALSRLHKNKAIDTLLSAFADVPGAYLWIAGDGPDEAALKKQMRALGLEDRVRFLGWRDDRWSLLASTDAVIFPSRHEPFGTTFVEAWAVRKPLVTTASQGPANFATHEKDALVTPIDDIPAMAQAMNRVKNDADLRARLVAEGAATYAQTFEKSAILDKWRRFLERVRP